MIDLKNLAQPPVLLAIAGSAALGFAAGFLLGRDPQLIRRALAAAAQGWEQARVAVAEAREDLTDQWAEATESARHDIEDAAFAAAATATSTAAETAAPEEREPAPRPKRRARASAARRSRAADTTH
jgi:hypothetical protein